jgi:hypothetical protein
MTSMGIIPLHAPMTGRKSPVITDSETLSTMPHPVLHWHPRERYVAYSREMMLVLSTFSFHSGSGVGTQPWTSPLSPPCSRLASSERPPSRRMLWSMPSSTRCMLPMTPVTPSALNSSLFLSRPSGDGIKTPRIKSRGSPVAWLGSQGPQKVNPSNTSSKN